MDDDDFGGFEAAENYKDGNGEPPVTSPAIPWAAFPTAPDIHVPQALSTEAFQEQSATSACIVSSDPFISSDDDIVIEGQPSSSTLNLADFKEQAPLSVDPSLQVPVSSLSLSEDVEKVTENDEELGLNESNKYLQQTLSGLEAKLNAADEEKCRIKKELEDLLEKYRILETDFLKHKEDKLISNQDRYNKLQEKHKLELEDLRRAGHEALVIIVEEFKALLHSTVQQHEEAIEKRYSSVVEKQAHKCEELLIAQTKNAYEQALKIPLTFIMPSVTPYSEELDECLSSSSDTQPAAHLDSTPLVDTNTDIQHQRLLDILDKEHTVLEEKIEESLLQQSQEYKKMLEKCMENERASNKEALAAAAKIEKEDIEAAILTAVKAERENMGKLHAAEKELWQAERNKNHEMIAQAIEDTIQEQRQSSQAIVKASIIEEQRKSEIAVEKAVNQTREELIEYIKEQKRNLWTECWKMQDKQKEIPLPKVLMDDIVEDIVMATNLDGFKRGLDRVMATDRQIDQVIRQRSLSSLELFLSCAQKQLSSLLQEEPTIPDAE